MDKKNALTTKTSRGDGELILVVDDEQSVREMITLGLTAQGYRVITAANGAEAISVFESLSGKVRLVLLDTDMPLLNGQATIPFLRAQAPKLPIILMSGELETIPETEGLVKLVKPFQLEELLRTISAELSVR